MKSILLIFFLSLFLPSCAHRSLHEWEKPITKKNRSLHEYPSLSDHPSAKPLDKHLAQKTKKLVPKSHQKALASKPPMTSSMSQVQIKEKGPLIILDAGHGGKDTGAKSVKNDYEEKALTLQTVNVLKTYLMKMGYEVVLTRKQDSFVDLEKRAEIANEMKAALFVSVHYNYCPNAEAEGIEIFYYKDEKNPYTKRLIESRRLGENVLSGIVKHTGALPRGVKRANFAVIRETKMPAILIEGGFLSNPSERNKILDQPYRKYLAFGIASGIDKYFNGR